MVPVWPQPRLSDSCIWSVEDLAALLQSDDPADFRAVMKEGKVRLSQVGGGGWGGGT
jgi:hypothetical protein